MPYISWTVVFEVNGDGFHDWTAKASEVLGRLNLTKSQTLTVKRRLATGEAAYRIDPPKLAHETPQLAIQAAARRDGIKYASDITFSGYTTARREFKAWIDDPQHPERWHRLYERASRSLREEHGPPKNDRGQGNIEALRSQVFYWPPRRVQGEDPYRLGVFRSAIATKLFPDSPPPYASRTIDSRLDGALLHNPLVLVVGPAKAGKSRSAIEAVIRSMPEATLLVPRRPEDLRPLIATLESDPIRDAAVLWLDEFQAYLARGSLDRADVERWMGVTPRVVGVGTITARAQQTWTNRSSTARQLFESVRQEGGELWLDSTLTNDELSAARSLYPHIPRSLCEHLVALDLLMLRLRNGIEECPEGVALVRAAIDCSIASTLRYVPEDWLVECWPYYLQYFGPTLKATKYLYNRALAWAGTPVSSSARLAYRVDYPSLWPPEPCITVLDALLEQAEQRDDFRSDMRRMLTVLGEREDAPHQCLEYLLTDLSAETYGKIVGWAVGVLSMWDHHRRSGRWRKNRRRLDAEWLQLMKSSRGFASEMQALEEDFITWAETVIERFDTASGKWVTGPHPSRR